MSRRVDKAVLQGGRHGPQAARGRRTGGGTVALAFARDRDGGLVAARRLDEATRRSRAPFSCPGCGDELVARLGAVRTRHFAHRPGSTCPLTAPETALHFNAKQRLLVLAGEAFAGARRVALVTRCVECRRADPRDLTTLGSEAIAEGAVGLLRADVLVTRAGRPSLAIEVLVTHAVDEAKEAALTLAGLPAVEVDAREAWEREGPGGSAEVVCDRSIGFPPCPACRIAARAEADRALGGEAAEVAELEAYRGRGLLKTPNTPPSRIISVPHPEPFDPDAPITTAERAELARRFVCPDCRRSSLHCGARLVRHCCPAETPRPVAWRGYDGALVELGWWKR